MAERFLQLDITKMLGTTLFLCVDDEDPTYEAYFKAESQDRLREFSKLCKWLPIAKAVEETIHDSDWGYSWNPKDEDFEVQSLQEVDKDEATMYSVFDVNSSKMYED